MKTIEDLLPHIPGEDKHFDEKDLLELAALQAELGRCSIGATDNDALRKLLEKVRDVRDHYSIRAGTCDIGDPVGVVAEGIFDHLSDQLDGVARRITALIVSKHTEAMLEAFEAERTNHLHNIATDFLAKAYFEALGDPAD